MNKKLSISIFCISSFFNLCFANQTLQLDVKDHLKSPEDINFEYLQQTENGPGTADYWISYWKYGFTIPSKNHWEYGRDLEN
jgi:hypothetical protein